MKHVRAAARLLAIFLVTSLVVLVLLPARLVGVLFPRFFRQMRLGIGIAWSRALLSILGARLEVRGAAPDPPFVLVSNHLSYIDVLVLMTHARGLFVAKSDIRSWPLIGPVASLGGAIFLDRKRSRDIPRINGLLEGLLQAGYGIIIFPEGTSSGGEEVGRFRSPLLEYPASESYPVHFAAVTYSTDSDETPASESVCWWGEMTFADHFYRLVALRSFHTKVFFSSSPICCNDRKVLADELQHAVAQSFIPVDSL